MFQTIGRSDDPTASSRHVLTLLLFYACARVALWALFWVWVIKTLTAFFLWLAAWLWTLLLAWLWPVPAFLVPAPALEVPVQVFEVALTEPAPSRVWTEHVDEIEPGLDEADLARAAARWEALQQAERRREEALHAAERRRADMAIEVATIQIGMISTLSRVDGPDIADVFGDAPLASGLFGVGTLEGGSVAGGAFVARGGLGSPERGVAGGADRGGAPGGVVGGVVGDRGQGVGRIGVATAPGVRIGDIEVHGNLTIPHVQAVLDRTGRSIRSCWAADLEGGEVRMRVELDVTAAGAVASARVLDAPDAPSATGCTQHRLTTVRFVPPDGDRGVLVRARVTVRP